MAGRRRFRRTRRVAIACALLALLLVGGPGLGEPSSPSPGDGRGDAGSDRRAGTHERLPGAKPDAPSGNAPASAGGAEGGAGRSGEGAHHEGDAARADPQTRDRVFGILAAARLATDSGELSVARRLLDAVSASVDPGVFVVAIEAEEARLLAALNQHDALLAADFAAGRALRAAARVEALTRELEPSIAAALEQARARRGWAALPPARVAYDPGTAAVLDDRRLVRVEFESHWRQATVVGGPGRDGTVTLRVETPAGLVFPAVDLAVLEPVAPSAAEIAAQINACIRAARPAAVWAWWMIARASGHELDPGLVRALEATHR